MSLSRPYELLNRTVLDASPSDEEIIERVRRGDTASYEIVECRYRRRFHGVVYRILHNDTEVDDTIQQAHLNALSHLSQFAGRSSFCTWLTRIVINEAFSRARVQRRFQQLDPALPAGDSYGFTLTSTIPDPEQQMLEEEQRAILARALKVLPEQYRAVFMMRDINQMSTAETAGVLGITEECVKTRLHRARAMLRNWIAKAHSGISVLGRR
jgi:RNA polymerase sigma-70 factor (ECF subfamily)